MSEACKYHAIIPAAGAGARMGSDIPKQYLTIAGKAVLEHSLDVLLACPRIQSLVLVLAEKDSHWPAIRERRQDNRINTVCGGVERSDSVLSGLDWLASSADENDWVLVHDAARPCLRLADIDALIDALKDDPVGGLLGVPVVDTMKRVAPDGAIMETLEREGLWHAQTPQMFRLGALRSALQQAGTRGLKVPDEACAMELAGQRPRMVPGHSDNIKLTRRGDLQLAEYYLRARGAT